MFDWDGQQHEVHYLPAESDSGMFGGNSNWRGPVWFPMNLVILRALAQLHRYYGDSLKVECPTGSGNEMNLLDVGRELGRRLASTFTEDENGRRPVFGGMDKFQNDPPGTIRCCSTSTSMATTAPVSAPATRPAGPGQWRCFLLGGALRGQSGATAGLDG